MGTVQISKRLKAVASLVTKGNILADIGTDHGYVPIYLIQQKIIPRAIAMDINKGPLERAREHIAGNGLSDHIETRLSDGAHELKPGEADSILIAGMGGALAIRIITESADVFRSAAEVIIQPQSEVLLVRKFILDNGYEFLDEDMVLEDGKFYPMMRVRFSQETGDISYTDVELRYGVKLLADKNEILLKYLDKERDTYTDIYRHLTESRSGSNEVRIKEIEYILECNHMAHNRFEVI
jgi:tRNA (adenine22-N1)-methyltransferase